MRTDLTSPNPRVGTPKHSMSSEPSQLLSAKWYVGKNNNYLWNVTCVGPLAHEGTTCRGKRPCPQAESPSSRPREEALGLHPVPLGPRLGGAILPGTDSVQSRDFQHLQLLSPLCPATQPPAPAGSGCKDPNDGHTDPGQP